MAVPSLLPPPRREPGRLPGCGLKGPLLVLSLPRPPPAEPSESWGLLSPGTSHLGLRPASRLALPAGHWLPRAVLASEADLGSPLLCAPPSLPPAPPPPQKSPPDPQDPPMNSGHEPSSYFKSQCSKHSP